MAYIRQYNITQDKGGEYDRYFRESDLESLHPTDDCFYCGKQLTCEDLVYWAGFGHEIWMHADCAKELGCRLVSDWMKSKETKAKELPKNG